MPKRPLCREEAPDRIFRAGTLESMKRFLILVPALVLALVAIGCGAKNKLVGSWTIEGAPVPVTETFNADGTSVTETTVPGSNVKITVDSTYTLDGTTLSGKGTKYTITGADKNMEAAMKTAMDKEIGKETKSTITWVNDDEFTAEMQGQKVTFKKKK